MYYANLPYYHGRQYINDTFMDAIYFYFNYIRHG